MLSSNESLSQFIKDNMHYLTNQILKEHLFRFPEFERTYDSDYKDKYIQDTNYTFQYLKQSLEANSPILFADYIQWLKTLMKGIRIPLQDLTEHLFCFVTILKVEVPEADLFTLNPYLDLIMPTLQEAQLSNETFIKSEDEWNSLARNYLINLNSGLRLDAVKQVMSLVTDEDSIKHIYLKILQPVQREIGRLWHTNQISVAHEHYATGVTQQIMSQLYPYIFNNNLKEKRFVATCVQGELHEIGLRMVTDMMELEGWNTWFLGANMPTGDLIRLLVERHADILAISATMAFHLGEVDKIIKAVRREDSLKTLRIMVGGYPFLLDAQLWEKIGADGFACDATEAVAIADNLHIGKGA